MVGAGEPISPGTVIFDTHGTPRAGESARRGVGIFGTGLGGAARREGLD